MLSFCLNCVCRNTVYLFFYIFLVSHISILWRKKYFIVMFIKVYVFFFPQFLVLEYY